MKLEVPPTSTFFARRAGAAALVAFMAVSVQACVPVRTRAPRVVSQRELQRTTEEVSPRSYSFGGRAALVRDTTLEVAGVQRCHVMRRDTVVTEREVVRERYNGAPGTDWAFGAVGAVSAGVGTFLVVDAEGLAASSAGDANPISPNAYRALGAALLGVGAAFLTIPIVDAIRSSGYERQRIRQVWPGRIAADAPCGETAAAGARIEVAIRGVRYLVGEADATGALMADLAAALPADLADGLDGQTTAEVLVNGGTVATIMLGGLVRAREEEAYQRLSLDACAARPSDQACAPLRAFVQRYPSGRRAGEVQAVLDEGARRLEAERAAQTVQRRAEEDRKRADEEAARAKEEQERRKRQMHESCARECQSACAGDADCARRCVGKRCGH